MISSLQRSSGLAAVRGGVQGADQRAQAVAHVVGVLHVANIRGSVCDCIHGGDVLGVNEFLRNEVNNRRHRTAEPSQALVDALPSGTPALASEYAGVISDLRLLRGRFPQTTSSFRTFGAEEALE